MGKVREHLKRIAATVLIHSNGCADLQASSVGLQIGRVSIPWRNIQSIHAFRRNEVIRDYFCLRFETTDRRKLELPETSSNWRYVCNMVDLFLPGSIAYTEWSVQLFDSKPGQEIPIYLTAPSFEPYTRVPPLRP